MFILDKTLCATHKYEIVSILSLTGLFFGDKLCDIVVYPPPPYYCYYSVRTVEIS